MCAMRTSGRTANDEAVPEPADGTAPGAAALPGQAAGQAGCGRDAVPDATGAGRPAPRNSDFVQSLDRGLAVIRSFGPDRERLTARTVTDPGRLREVIGDVARQGYAIVDQELEEGLRAVAATIRGAPDVGSAAINVSAHAARVSIASLRGDILPALLDTAKAIEADLQAQGGT